MHPSVAETAVVGCSSCITTLVKNTRLYSSPYYYTFITRCTMGFLLPSKLWEQVNSVGMGVDLGVTKRILLDKDELLLKYEGTESINACMTITISML